MADAGAASGGGVSEPARVNAGDSTAAPVVVADHSGTGASDGGAGVGAGAGSSAGSGDAGGSPLVRADLPLTIEAAPGSGLPAITYSEFKDNSQMPGIVALMEKDLSEPYTLYTYRYFIFSWPHLCILAHCNDELVGVIVCKEEVDQRKRYMRGYIAMLAVADAARRRGIGTTLASLAVDRMAKTCPEVVLETELSNKGALNLYYNLGFVRDKFLPMYYLNGGDAFRLKLWTGLDETPAEDAEFADAVANAVSVAATEPVPGALPAPEPTAAAAVEAAAN